MSLVNLESLPKSRLKVLLDHFGEIEDPREPWRVAHPLPEVLLLAVCGTICDCDDYDAIAAWGEAHLPFLRRYLPYHHGVPGGRWLTLLMNRIDPTLFSAAFTAWVRQTWPGRADLIAIDGKTSRRSHDRQKGQAPLHLVSAFATTARLVLGQEAVADKQSETGAIPLLIERLAEKDGLKGALVTIDAVATNPTIAGAIRSAGADYLLAVKANQPSLRAEMEAVFAQADGTVLDTHTDLDKGHGRIEERRVSVARGRLALGRAPLSGRVAPARRGQPGAGGLAHRTEAPKPLRDALLHLLGPAHGRAGRRGRAGSLGYREPSALGAGRGLWRRSVEAATGARGQKHGGGAPLRPQSHAGRHGQEEPQAAPQGRRMGPELPR